MNKNIDICRVYRYEVWIYKYENKDSTDND
jgi:hypothetical protein